MIINPLAQYIQYSSEIHASIRNSGVPIPRGIKEGEWIIYIPGTNWFMAVEDRVFLNFFGAEKVVEGMVIKREAEKGAAKIFERFPEYHEIIHYNHGGAILINQNQEKILIDQKLKYASSDEIKSWLVENNTREESLKFILKVLDEMPWRDYGTITKEELEIPSTPLAGI